MINMRHFMYQFLISTFSQLKRMKTLFVTKYYKTKQNSCFHFSMLTLIP